jgi:SepF-like predicted cell division protein (DUF552 family)
MGLMSSIFGGRASRSTEDYVEVNIDDVEHGGGDTGAGLQVHIAEIGGQRDVIAIKDAIYDGDLVIAEITTLRTGDSTADRIRDELRQVAREVDGDIVQKGDDQLIITPTGISISRSKLGQ